MAGSPEISQTSQQQEKKGMSEDTERSRWPSLTNYTVGMTQEAVGPVVDKVVEVAGRIREGAIRRREARRPRRR